MTGDIEGEGSSAYQKFNLSDEITIINNASIKKYNSLFHCFPSFPTFTYLVF